MALLTRAKVVVGLEPTAARGTILMALLHHSDDRRRKHALHGGLSAYGQ
jgi:hypothetical protein